jgi:hypothetical protein
LQSILLISHCVTLTIFFPILPLIVSCQPSFSNPSLIFFFALLFPHLIVTLLPTIPILFFWLFFSPLYSTPYRYNSSNSSSLFFTLLLPIFFSISPYVILLPTIPLPFWLFFSHYFFFYSSSIFFCYYFLYTSLFHSVHVLPTKKVITLLLSFNGFFFFFKLFLATLLLVYEFLCF